jgi:putative oxidoreductase
LPDIRHGVYIGEIVAPILLIVGVWTRLAALLIASTWSSRSSSWARRTALAQQVGGGTFEVEAFTCSPRWRWR